MRVVVEKKEVENRCISKIKALFRNVEPLQFEHDEKSNRPFIANFPYKLKPYDLLINTLVNFISFAVFNMYVFDNRDQSKLNFLVFFSEY